MLTDWVTDHKFSNREKIKGIVCTEEQDKKMCIKINTQFINLLGIKNNVNL